ncbi:MAG: CRTAC1 family protein [Planctomycetota bacterium]|nr:CRTAC1 family protein [Planctomycetota bacterium]
MTNEPAPEESQEEQVAERGTLEEGELVSVDDRVISTFFWWSLAVFALVGGVVGLVVYLSTREPPQTVVEERPFVPPKEPLRTARPPTVRFTDITVAAGIRFHHENGARGEKLLPETMGPGCAFLDHDGDEDPDIVLVNATVWPGDPAASEPPPTPALYRNDGGGAFTEVTREAGLAVSLYGMGVAVADYDGDGRVDVFLTAVGENRLFRNVGGRFEEVTRQAGVAGGADEWSTSAGFFDGDGDGDLDLFVCNYVRWSREIDANVNYRLVGVGRAYGPPTHFEGTQPYYYRNDGDGTFTEVAAQVGLHVTNAATGVPVAKALALIPFDVDLDGWMDILVANDTVRNFLFKNRGDGTFVEEGRGLGVAYDSDGNSTGAMGVDAAYYRNDRSLALAVGNFATEMSSLYVTEEDTLLFTDHAINEGIGPVSRQMLSFGLFFFDYDLDGRTDLFQTNGHLEEEINQVQPSQHYRQPSQLFWNVGPSYRSTFVPVDGATVGDLSQPVVGRAASYADIDGDGDLDILITQTGGSALLLRNDQELGHGWLRLRLVGSRKNRDAIGARVEVDAGGVTQRRQVMPTRSYLSQVESVLTFGLGESPRADAVRVWWPGEREPRELGSISANTYRVIQRD